MKYLKKYFESADSEEDQYHIDVIKDVFQDIFDEWGIEEDAESNRWSSGLYWTIAAEHKLNYINKIDRGYWLFIRKYKFLPHGEGGDEEDNLTKVAIPPIDISGHIKTLQSMGYKVDTRGYVIGSKYINLLISI